MPETYTMNELRFNEMMSDHNWQVKRLDIKETGKEKFKFRTGQKKIVKYRSEVVKGKEIPNYYADVSFEDVFQEKEISVKQVTFEFINTKDENEFLDWLKK